MIAPMNAGTLPSRLRSARFLATALLFSIAGSGLADYPRRGASPIVDGAQLLSKQDAATLLVEIATFTKQTGMEVAVFTVPSYLGQGTGDASFEAFATNLFNQNGIGNARRNDGLMLLVAKAERKIRIEVGSGHGRSLDAPMKVVLDTVMTPEFKAGRFSEGILVGAREMMRRARTTTSTSAAHALTGRPTSARPPAPTARPFAEAPPGYTPPPVAPPRATPSSGGQSEPHQAPPTTAPDAGWLAPLLALLGIGGAFFFGPLAAVAALGAVALLFWFRSRRRRCGECRVRMLPLSELEDDRFLQPGQIREEQIGAVNYEVLVCPSCQKQRIIRHSRWFSGFSDCPQCGNKTLSSESTIIAQPTYTSPGERLIKRRCHHCSHRAEHTQVIPMREHSTSLSVSAGGGSFGGSSGSDHSSGGHSSGGHSSGGGASGGW